MSKNFFSTLQQVGRLGRNRKHSLLSLGGGILLSWLLVCSPMAADGAEYEASQVDSPPKLVRQMPVTYPSDAKRNRVEGRVVVRCLIGTKGKAEKLEIVESEPTGVFDNNVLKSLKYWQFRPGIKEGELVATWVKIPLNFNLD